jgi:hypothetical protein
MGMFYRWGVDLCKMPFKSVSGNKYVVVMIEHFSKWIELVPIPEKTSHHTAAALRGVLCRYGAPAEVLTDQGEEFQGELMLSYIIPSIPETPSHSLPSFSTPAKPPSVLHAPDDTPPAKTVVHASFYIG